MSLLITPTRAVIVDIVPDQLEKALHEETHALVHVHNGVVAEEVQAAAENVDIVIYSVPDALENFSREHSDLYAVLRGIVAPFKGQKAPDTIAYLAKILPDLYPVEEEAPPTKPFQIINGADDHDADVFSTCMHYPDIDCHRVEGQPLTVNGTVYEGGDVDEWIRAQLVPDLIMATDIRGLTLGIRMYKRHLFVFVDDAEAMVPHVLPVAREAKSDTATLLLETGHPLAEHFDMSDVGAVMVLVGNNTLNSTNYVGEITTDTLRRFVTTI